MLRSIDWELFIDVSGQPSGPIFQIQSHLQRSSSLYRLTLEDGTARLSRNVGNQVSNYAT
jgi:hypothetical protein